MNSSHYHQAQIAIADLKTAVLAVLGGDVEDAGMAADEVGRLLGINSPHLESTATLAQSILEILSGERIVKCDDSGFWRLR